MEYQALHDSPWLHGSFWVFVAIVVFAVLAGRKLVGAIIGLLDARTAAVQAALDEAAALKTEAQAMLADAKARQEQAAKDAATILDYARTQAAAISATLAADAAASAKRREQMALDRIAAAEAAALQEVRAAAIDIAAAAAAASLRESVTADADTAFIDHAIGGIPAALRRAI